MIKTRIEKLQSQLENNQAMLITSGVNRFYYTGFKSSAGVVVITKNNAYLLIDFRYIEKAKATVKCLDVILSQRQSSEIYELLKKHQIKSLFLESDSVSIGEYSSYQSQFEGIEVLTSDKMTNFITLARSVKSKQEIDNIIQAQKITDATFDYITNNICVGKTEKEIMLDMEFFMRKMGGEGVSFDFIVVSGKNSSLPHGVPTDKKIENGDFITMDFGCLYNGYCSDMTRTVAVGNVSDEQKLVYNTVLKAQLAALDVVKAGVVCKDIDKVARDIIYSAGYEGCFGHGLGHSLGIEVHESPAFNMRDTTVLKEGTVMTVEPGIYIENKFGVRIEDMVVATANGCKNLTNSPKELIIL